MTSDEVIVALETRFSGEGYALLRQVANGTGMQATRTADAIAVQLWPSRGITFHGIEVKVSRGDFWREVKNPEKAEEIAQYCHQWSIAAPKGVVPIEEVPAGWGLFEVHDNGKVRTRRTALLREPEPPSHLFVAAICRNLARVDDKEKKRIREEAYDRGYAEGKAGTTDSRRAERAEQALARMQEKLSAFERDSGITISEWGVSIEGERGYQGHAIAAAVKQVLAGEQGLNQARSRLVQMKNEAAWLIEHLDQAVAKAGVP